MRSWYHLSRRVSERHEGLLPITLNAADIRAHSTSIYRSQVSFFFCHSFVNFLISGILTLFDSELLFFSSFSFSLFFPPPLQQTLQNVLLGLYNMDERSKDVSDSRISINVTSKPEIDEFQYSPDRNKCSHLLKLHQVLTHHSLVMPMLTENEANVLNKMQSLFHYEKLATTRVRSTLVCLRSHGRSMPDGITAEDVVLLERANSMMEYKKYANSDYFKLLLAFIIFVYLLQSTLSLRFSFVYKYPKLSTYGLGIIGGTMSGLTNIVAPLMIMYTMELNTEN